MAHPSISSAKKDQHSIVEPGYTVGGAIWKNKLWIFSSYIPSIDTTRRTTNFTAANPGPRTLNQTTTHAQRVQPPGLRRDQQPASLRLLELWLLPQTGTLGGADSTSRTASTPDAPPTPTPSARMPVPSILWPSTPSAAIGLRPRNWWSAPATATSSTTTNSAERRSGTRLQLFETRSTPPRSIWPANSASQLCVQHLRLRQHSEQPGHGLRRLQAQGPQRRCLLLRRHFGGTHTFKGGFFWQQQSQRRAEDLQRRRGHLSPGARAIRRSPAPPPAMDHRARTKSHFGNGACQGKYGYFIVGTGVVNTGADHQTAQGVLLPGSLAGRPRPDPEPRHPPRQENQPPYDPDPLPLRQVRLGRQDCSPHRRRLRSAAQRQGQGLRQLRQVLRHHENGSGARFLRQRLLAQLRVRHGRYQLHAPSLRPIPIGGGCPATGPAPGVTTAASSRTSTSAPPRPIPATRRSARHEAHAAARIRDRRRFRPQLPTGPWKPATPASAWIAPSKTWRSPTTWASTSATPAPPSPTCCIVRRPSLASPLPASAALRMRPATT